MPGERRKQTPTREKSVSTVIRPIHGETEAYGLYAAIWKCVVCCYGQLVGRDAEFIAHTSEVD